MLGVEKGNFPEVAEFKGPLALIPSDIFQAFIARTIFAVTNEESRYVRVVRARLEDGCDGWASAFLY